MLASLSIFLLASPASAFWKESGTKFGRGITNIVGCWLEIPFHIAEQTKSENILMGIPTGSVKGAIIFPLRLLSGTWDFLTWPIPIPGEYEPIMKPDYPPWISYARVDFDQM